MQKIKGSKVLICVCLVQICVVLGYLLYNYDTGIEIIIGNDTIKSSRNLSNYQGRITTTLKPRKNIIDKIFPSKSNNDGGINIFTITPLRLDNTTNYVLNNLYHSWMTMFIGYTSHKCTFNHYVYIAAKNVDHVSYKIKEYKDLTLIYDKETVNTYYNFINMSFRMLYYFDEYNRKQNNKYDYYVKIDSDVFANLPLLCDKLLHDSKVSSPKTKVVYGGKIGWSNQIHIDGKWPDKEFKFQTKLRNYIPYAHGPLYFLSQKGANYLNTFFINFKDILVPCNNEDSLLGHLIGSTNHKYIDIRDRKDMIQYLRLELYPGYNFDKEISHLKKIWIHHFNGDYMQNFTKSVLKYCGFNAKNEFQTCKGP